MTITKLDLERLEEFYRQMQEAGKDCTLPLYSPGACGIWPFLLPEVHPFNPACVWHDKMYICHDWTLTTEEIDLEFFNRCMGIAGEDKVLVAEAHACYKACRTWGTMRFYLAKVGISWAHEPCSGGRRGPDSKVNKTAQNFFHKHWVYG